MFHFGPGIPAETLTLFRDIENRTNLHLLATVVVSSEDWMYHVSGYDSARDYRIIWQIPNKAAILVFTVAIVNSKAHYRLSMVAKLKGPSYGVQRVDEEGPYWEQCSPSELPFLEKWTSHEFPNFGGSYGQGQYATDWEGYNLDIAVQKTVELAGLLVNSAEDRFKEPPSVLTFWPFYTFPEHKLKLEFQDFIQSVEADWALPMPRKFFCDTREYIGHGSFRGPCKDYNPKS